jgi:hypothetical protein
MAQKIASYIATQALNILRRKRAWMIALYIPMPFLLGERAWVQGYHPGLSPPLKEPGYEAIASKLLSLIP